jgi:transcriptional regulator with XRE-family HTH domain
VTPDELLRRYPRETLRWLRGRLKLSQEAFAERAEVQQHTVASWESHRRGISPRYRARLAALLAPHLATPEGAAFVASLGQGGEGHVGEMGD